MIRHNDPRLHDPIPGIGPVTILTPDVCNQLQEHALEVYPQECLGYVQDGQYHRLENVSPDPEGHARVDPVVLAELLDEGIDALCHSHPDGPDCPSAADMRLQMDLDIPFALVSTNGQACLEPYLFGDMVAKPPLLGRSFRHGVIDCYGLIRDFYGHILNIQLDDFPRDWEWWAKHKECGEGLYEQNFAKWGFREIDGDLQVGDVFLLQAGARVPNHAGIYLGGGLMLHHLAGRLEADASRISTIEPVIRWQQHSRMGKVVRHGG